MKICGHNYRIKFMPKLREYDIETRTYSGKEVYGQTNYDLGQIEINTSLPKSVQEATLIHEILHAMIFHTYSRNNHDEAIIQALANGFYQMGAGRYLIEKMNGGKK